LAAGSSEERFVATATQVFRRRTSVPTSIPASFFAWFRLPLRLPLRFLIRFGNNRDLRRSHTLPDGTLEQRACRLHFGRVIWSFLRGAEKVGYSRLGLRVARVGGKRRSGVTRAWGRRLGVGDLAISGGSMNFMAGLEKISFCSY
jgi:hypothetical protein